MSIQFLAKVTRSCPQPCATLDVNVYQQYKDNNLVCVANIQDEADPMDHRTTKITYANGCLHFSDTYDGPLVAHCVSSFFYLENKNTTDIELHYFCHSKQWYLCNEDGFFPIEVTKESKHDFFKIIVYSPFSTEKNMLRNHPTLAVITQTESINNGFCYNVCMDNLPELPFLMAIFSLPFTLNLIIS